MGLLDMLFGSKPKPVPGQGGGLLAAQPVIVTRQAYNDYAEMAMTKGQPVLPYDQWVKQQQAPQPVQAPAQ